MKLQNSQLKYLNRRNGLILLIIATIVSVILIPVSGTRDEIVTNLPWLGASIIITEGLFIIGIGLMAYEAGHELGMNPVLWRKKLHQVVNHIVKTRLFWIGFWINALGAIGTALVISIGIVISLPPQSWGLLWLSVADLGFTIAIRAAAVLSIEAAK